MKFLKLSVVSAFVVLSFACGGGDSKSGGGTGNPAAPTPAPAPAPTPPPAPAPIAKADLRIASQAVITCFTGLCTSMRMSITDVGPGCATNVRVVVRWYGSDGAAVLPNTPDIPMDAPGGLANVFFRVGDVVAIESVGTFNDVRSAHTVYRAFADWTDVACR
jgi:hypothetical protein